MNKICTSIEQSEKLIELGIDVNSADMYYEAKKFGETISYSTTPKVKTVIVDKRQKYGLPCWSLAALFEVIDTIKREVWFYDIQHDMSLGWSIEIEGGAWDEEVGFFDNPLDACVKMIEKLHERKLL